MSLENDNYNLANMLSKAEKERDQLNNRLLAMSEYYDKLQTEYEDRAKRNGDCEFLKGFAHACKIFKSFN